MISLDCDRIKLNLISLSEFGHVAKNGLFNSSIIDEPKFRVSGAGRKKRCELGRFYAGMIGHTT